MNARATLAAPFAGLLLTFLLVAAPAVAQITVLASVPAQDRQGNAASQGAAASPDGRYVAFQSDATDLVPGDTNGVADVFLRDTVTQRTRRVSIALDGAQANGASGHPAVSADGRYVAFASAATNLLAGDANGASDIFLRDTVAGTTQRVSVTADGLPANGASFAPAISADGRYVAYESSASNIVSGDTNGESDIFVRDIQTGTTTWVSRTWFDAAANGRSSAPSISADGRFVAFSTDASNLVLTDTNNTRDIYVRDLVEAAIIPISLTSTGGESNGVSQFPAISADGTRVAFQSAATNLVPNDTNGCDDVFVRDVKTGALSLVSLAPNGAQGNDFSYRPAISADGRYVTFLSDASNFASRDANNGTDVFVRDTEMGTTEAVSVAVNLAPGNALSGSAVISADGRYVAFDSASTNLVADDANGAADVFVRDRAAGLTRLISRGASVRQGNDNSVAAVISGDGRYVAFESNARNLVYDDTNFASDVFLRDLDGTTTRVSVSSDGTQADGDSLGAAIGADGRYVAFASDATNLVTGDTNDRADIFVRDAWTGLTQRVSVGSGGTQGNGDSLGASISGDGRLVAFQSDASNLVAGDANLHGDIFVRDLLAGTTAMVSVASDGTAANGQSLGAAISANGRYVAFESTSSNIVPGDGNGRRDVFLRDLAAGTTIRVSIASDGAEGDGDSMAPSVSADGRYVAFASRASSLVADDTNNLPDVFVRDTVAGTTRRASVASGGAQGDGDSGSPSLSADGRFVAFHSIASNLVPDDTNQAFDVFVRDMAMGTTARASIATDGAQGDALSVFPSLSADGRYVAFYSQAAELVPDDTNAATDVFVRGPLPVPAPYTLADAQAALRIAAGLAAAAPDDATRLDVDKRGPAGVDIRDAAAILRAVNGQGT